MERSRVLDASRQRRASGTLGQLKLYGMRTACDEIIATALKRQHEPQQIIHCPAGAWQRHAAERGRPLDHRDQ